MLLPATQPNARIDKLDKLLSFSFRFFPRESEKLASEEKSDYSRDLEKAKKSSRLALSTPLWNNDYRDTCVNEL